MKIIRIDRIGDYERRIEVEYDGNDISQHLHAVDVIFTADDLVGTDADTET